MHKKLIEFIKYNNAFTIIFVIVFLGAGIGFAANPEMRGNIYSSQDTVVTVDNSAIVSADLDNYNFSLRINNVTDDGKNYYATYSYWTMAIIDGVWQNQKVEKTLTVSKEALGNKDLGLYIARELGENINYELSSLKRIQKSEREKGESQKVVATEYSGLIGKLLDPKEQVIEGYNPVIPEPVAEVPEEVELGPEEVIVSTRYPEPEDRSDVVPPVTPPATDDGSTGGTGSGDTGTTTSDTGSTTPPIDQTPEATSTPSSTPPVIEPEPEPEPEATTTPPQIDPIPDITPPPPPEEMIDEELVQEVVEELLQENNSETPAPEPVAP